jgi:hypothetical protein
MLLEMLLKIFDVKDAAQAFVMSGGNPYAAAFAGTSGDEKLGFNPFSWWNFWWSWNRTTI